MRKAKKLLKTGMLLLSISLLAGCASKIVFFPITGQDIVFLKQGENLTAPKQGAFLSDMYLDKVLEAQIKHG